MAGRKKRPTLRLSKGYWVTTIYKPDGARGTISFGPLGSQSESEIRIAFEQWIELYLEHPRKTLTYSSPYEALEYMINPTTITTIGQLFEKYEVYFSNNVSEVRNGQEHPDLRLIKCAHRFIKPYSEWSVDSFGPDELNAIRDVLLVSKYKSGKKLKAYTRRGINDILGCIIKTLKWGVGRRIVDKETLICIENEFKKLKMGEKGAIDNGCPASTIISLDDK